MSPFKSLNSDLKSSLKSLKSDSMSPLSSLESTPETIKVDLHISDSVEPTLTYCEIKIKTYGKIFILIITNI